MLISYKQEHSEESTLISRYRYKIVAMYIKYSIFSPYRSCSSRVTKIHILIVRFVIILYLADILVHIETFSFFFLIRDKNILRDF